MRVQCARSARAVQRFPQGSVQKYEECRHGACHVHAHEVMKTKTRIWALMGTGMGTGMGKVMGKGTGTGMGMGNDSWPVGGVFDSHSCCWG